MTMALLQFGGLHSRFMHTVRTAGAIANPRLPFWNLVMESGIWNLLSSSQTIFLGVTQPSGAQGRRLLDM
jgi:hypothetical protein